MKSPENQLFYLKAILETEQTTNNTTITMSRIDANGVHFCPDAAIK
ncbi:MAG: hypothetical protein H8E79_04725 [Desulfobulbaceae bacterium]|uniref:Uncharacterized protein n=1 Tax=Candidatus Desulfatifera sulfidica TaxID=2841691 RepID=A0A8J6N9U6_9BACT|nr:hypothetical protein [Candidatus Desulfatifera sulfidica]